MQEVSHKIHIKKNGTQYDINLYDNKFPSPDIFFPVKISGSAYYIPATPYLKEDAAGGRTPLRIKKDGVTYQVIKKAECNINIPSYANQKIVVEVTNSITGNKATYTNTNTTEGNINTVVVPFGSSFVATVQSTNSSYNAGSMTSIASGVITEKTINLTASPATIAIPIGSLRITSDITFTVPAGITVIAINEGSSTNYISVRPNSTHRLRWNRFNVGGEIVMWFMKCDTHPDSDFWTAVAHDSKDVTLSWSPEINKHSTNMNCY